MERMNTHDDDPEHRKDEQDILGKMMNMISSLREELSKLWTRNAVLEKELSVLRPNAVCDCASEQEKQPILCDNEGDREKALEPSPNEGDGGAAVESLANIRSPVEVEDVVMKED
jgi:hypothetical protein